MEPITKINHSVDKENFRVYIRALESKDYLVTYAWRNDPVYRISAHILENNYASINSIEKFGFIKEGILRNASFKGGRFINLIVYSLLREEFINKYKIE